MHLPQQKHDGYTFHLTNIDCLRGATSFNVIMQLDRSLHDLMPYLASYLPGCSYVHGAEEISLMDAGHIVVIYPEKMTFTDVRNEEEAASICRRYVEIVRHVAARTGEIQPVYSKKVTVSVLQILQGLPGTNCGACGDATCMAFASRVFRREIPLSACPELSLASGAVQDLLALLRENGYALPEGKDPPS